MNQTVFREVASHNFCLGQGNCGVKNIFGVCYIFGAKQKLGQASRPLRRYLLAVLAEVKCR